MVRQRRPSGIPICSAQFKTSPRLQFHFPACVAASSISAATSFGCEMYTQWLAPETSTLWLLARAAYQRSRSGLMVLSLPATTIQLGLLLHAAVVMTALKFSALFSTCDRAMNAACSADRSAAKYS